MKKSVNGKVVDIENIDLFIRAAKDSAVQKTTISVTSDGIKNHLESQLLQEYIYMYNIFYKALPFPLYAVEDDIKYAVLAEFISNFSSDKHVWVNNGLYGMLDTESGMAVHFVQNTWSIVYVSSEDIGNEVDFETYKNNIGYKDYKWVRDKILRKEGLDSYYKEVMPKFYAACNGDGNIISWELSNMLLFGSIPDKQELNSSCIINVDNGKEYYIDIYYHGMKETDEEMKTLNLTYNRWTVSKKRVKVFRFDCYERSTESEASPTSLVKIGDGKASFNDASKHREPIGIRGMFVTLCGLRGQSIDKKFPKFRGISDTYNIFYEADGKLYAGKMNKDIPHELISDCVEIYGLSRGCVYYTRRELVAPHVYQESLYCYNPVDSKKRVCLIRFV